VADLAGKPVLRLLTPLGRRHQAPLRRSERPRPPVVPRPEGRL
jgi:hypothetical protein